MANFEGGLSPVVHGVVVGLVLSLLATPPLEAAGATQPADDESGSPTDSIAARPSERQAATASVPSLEPAGRRVGTVDVVRYAGSTRVDTARKLATTAAINTPAFDGSTVVIGRQDDYADNLAGSYLAGLFDAPILLTATDELSAATASAVDEIDPDRVIVLGGVNAVADSVLGELDDEERQVERVAGATRFDTAAEVSRFRDEQPELALVASGEAFPDALAAGAIAAAEGAPLLLVGQDLLPAATGEALESLDVDEVVIAGGPAAVSEGVEQRIGELGLATSRAAGSNRFATARELASFAEDRFGWARDHLNLVSGVEFADAVTMAAHAGRGVGGPAPLALTAGSQLSPQTEAWLDDVGACNFAQLSVAGGGAAVPKSVEASALNRLAPDCPDDDTVPEVAISTPETAAAEGGRITVTGTATDDTSGVRTVALEADGQLVAADYVPRGETPREWELAVTPPESGDYELRAVVTDGAGNDGVATQEVRFEQHDEDEVVVNPSTVVLDETQRERLIDLTDHSMRFSGDAESLGLRVGDVAVSEPADGAPQGLLRRVGTIREDGDEVVVGTDVAALTDAVWQGALRVNQELDPPSDQPAAASAGTVPGVMGAETHDDVVLERTFRFPYSANVQLRGTPLEDGPAQVEGTATVDGEFEARVALEADLMVSVDWGWFDTEVTLERFLVAAGLGLTNELDYGLEVEAGAEFPIESLASRDWRHAPYTFTVGPVPVVLTGTLNADIELGGSVGANFSGRAELAGSMRAGMEYTAADGWDGIWESDVEISHQPLQLDEFTLDSRANLPRVTYNSRLYDAAGPMVSVTPYANPSVATSGWEVAGGISAEAGAELTVPIVDRQLAGIRTTLFDQSWPILQGDFGSDPFTLAVTNPAAGAEIPCCDVLLRSAVSHPGEEGLEPSWSSDVDGALGTGDRLRATLTPGTHQIAASVTDDAGVTQTDDIEVTVVDDDADETVFRVTDVAAANDALALAQRMATDDALVSDARFEALPPAGEPNGFAVNAPGVSGAADPIGVLTTGDVTLADLSNTDLRSISNQGEAVRGPNDFDVVVLAVDVAVPSYANCLRLDFRFLSEEFPEWVGSEFNDAFIAELGESTWTTTADAAVEAPDNFAFDPTGRVITVNDLNINEVQPENALGTTYDAATLVLQAAAEVEPGEHTLYLSMFDQGDRYWDSATFVNHLQAVQVSDPEQHCVSGASPRVQQ